VTPDAHLPDAGSDRLVHSTLALLISNGTGVVLGVTFWLVAAHLYSPTNVGYGAAEVSAMTLLSAIAFLNLGTVFPRFLYAAGSRAGIILRSGYVASTSIAFVAAVIFALFFRHTYIESGFLPTAVFVASVVFWVIFTIEDAALIGFRRTFWVPVENTSFSIVKIALLPVFVVVAPRVGVYSSWVLPVVGCVTAINLYLWRRVLPDHERHASGAGVLPDRRVIKNVVLGEYLGGLSFTAMAMMPALMVAAILDLKHLAYFQTPWLAGTSFDALLFSFATSLIVEATARPTAAPTSVKRTVRLALRILGPSVIVIIVAAPWFLRLQGAAYAAHGTRLLQLLALALPFMAVNVLYVTYARMARRVRRVVMVQVSISAVVLSMCFGLLHTSLGITGAGVAYLAGQGLMAVILLPSVVRQYRRPDMAPDYAPGAAMVARSSGLVDTANEDPGATTAVAASDPQLHSTAPEAPPSAAAAPVRASAPPASTGADVPMVWRRRTAPPVDAASSENGANASSTEPSHLNVADGEG